MSDLRIGVLDLSPKDAAYIRALVRLFAHTEKLGWSFVEHPPYHAVVADGAARAEHSAFFKRFTGLVLTMVAPPGAPEANTVAYPIHADQFRDWLKLRQAELMNALYRTEEQTAEPRHLGQRRFKLRRWPASALLQGDPLRLRIATLMSRNAMNTAQLAQMTGQAEESCREFLGALQTAGLLLEVREIGAAPAAVPAMSPQVPAQTVPAEVQSRRGLMASLRRRFGL